MISFHNPCRHLLALATMALVPLAGCEKKAVAPPPMGPMPVSIVNAQQADVPLGGDWVGTLDGFVNAQIQPQVSGYLLRQNYREGDRVSKGQVLFEIDPRPFQASVDQALGQLGQANGALAQAQANLGLAQINVRRDTPLAQQHAIAQSQLDTDTQTEQADEAAVKTAQAQIAAANASVQTARINLGFTHVHSLISGVAGQATVQVGNLVNAASVLTIVSQLDPIKSYFSISDSEYLTLTNRTGGDLLHSRVSPALTLTLANGTTYPHRGHIVFVDRGMNQQTGAIRIAAAFPNPGNVLRPGQFGRVQATTEVVHNAILVPQLAVSELQGIQQVHTVVDGKVHTVNVTLGQQSGPNWIIQSGLAAGTPVIVDNLQKLQDGMPVSPHPAPAPTSGEPTASAAGR